jgi:hypothetical protein
MIHKNIPIGGLDLDSDLRDVAPQDYVDARNIRNGYGSTIGAATIAKGNELVSATMPSGYSHTIGTVEDKDTKSIIYFVRNTQDNHMIWRYWPDDVSPLNPNGRIEKLIESSELNFGANWLIHSAKIIDGKLLYWTDCQDEDNGNEPRKLNLDKLSVYLKPLSYTLYFGDESFPTGRQLEIQEKNGATVTIPYTVFYTVPAGTPTAQTVLNQIAAQLNASYNVTAEVDGLSIIVTHDTEGYSLDIRGVAPNVVHFCPLNHYDVDEGNPNILAEQITIIKPVPRHPPKPFYSHDSDISENRVYGYSFQFRYQYVFDDREISPWSSASYVPTNFSDDDGVFAMNVKNSEYYNKITIDLNDDELLNDAQWKGLITGVNLAVKTSEEGLWKFVDYFPNKELGVEVNEISFYNDRVYSVIASDNASSEDVQALKNFSFVPKKAMSLEAISDERGNSMISMFGTLEYYNTPKINANVSVQTAGPAFPVFPSNQGHINHSLKTGGIYRVGVVLEDTWGRQSSVVPLGRINVPFGQKIPLLPYVEVEFLSTPPDWADHFRLCLSKNQNQQIYVQVPAFEVNYCIYNSGTDTIGFTTHAAGDADFVAFTFNDNDIDQNFLNVLFDETLKNNTVNVFLPEPNDRLQILSWDEYDDVSTGSIENYNYKIIGYNLTKIDPSATQNGFHVFIEFDTSQPDFDQISTPTAAVSHYLCEIYRPGAETSDEIYYEIGPCFPINGGSYGGTVDLEQWGDTFNTYKKYTDTFDYTGAPWNKFEVDWVQRNKLHDDTDFVLSDLGRAVVYDRDLKEEFFRGRIRSSDIYKPSTSFNGLSDFQGTNYITINNTFGRGMKLAKVESVLLAVCEFKTQPIYIGKDRTLDLSGNTFLGRSQELFNIANELQKDYGTANPESIVNEEGRVYCFDAYKGVVWRYTTGSGQVAISELGLRNYFLELAKLTSSQAAIGGFQREFATYYIQLGKEIIAFQENNGEQTQKNKFPCFYDFGNAEYFGWAGMYFVSFYEGQVYLHERGTNANYFGDQFDATITVVVNNDPDIVKMPLYVLESANELWEIEEVIIPETSSYANGMTSEILENKWTEYEGQFRADFLRDSSDPYEEFAALSSPEKEVAALLRGRFLRGEVVTLKLRLTDPTTDGVIKSITTFLKK